jgi:hypothetical protein
MDRMRRAGIKYTDLPYYLPRKDEVIKKFGTDYIRHLYVTLVKPKKFKTLIDKY